MSSHNVVSECRVGSPRSVQKFNGFVGFIQPLLVGLGASALSMFMFTLQFFPIWARASDFMRMAENPLTRQLNEPILAYRILAPGLAWLVGLQGPIVLAIPYVSSVVCLALLYVILRPKIGSRMAVLATIGLSFTHMILWTNNHFGVPDSLTHVATCLCLMSSSPLLLGVWTLLGMLNDERFILAVPFILIWHRWHSTAKVKKTLDWKPLIGAMLGLCIYILVRHALTAGWIGPGLGSRNVYQKAVDTSIIRTAIQHPLWYGINVFMAFRWIWCFPLLAVILGWRKDGFRIDRAVYAIAIVGTIIGSAFVWDISRSISFAFPAVLLGLTIAYERSPSICYKTLLFAVVACGLTPAFFLSPGGLQLYMPAPFVIVRHLTGFDVVDLIRTKGYGRFGVI